MSSGKMPNGGGNDGSRKLGDSKVYARKSSKESQNFSLNDENLFDVTIDEHLSEEEKGFRRQDNRVTISLAMKKKGEVREIRRKLERELILVRSLVQKIETQEGAKNGLKRVHSDLGSRPVSEKNRNSVENLEKEKRTPKANKMYKNSDFLLGKDKMPVVESSKKPKGNGRKSGGGGVGGSSGGGGGKEKADEDGSNSAKFSKQMLKNCTNLLEKLMKHKHGWVFNNPVDHVALGLHDYPQIIKNPMDLGTVKSRLSKNLYKSPQEFSVDVRRTFENAMTYNPEGQDVYLMAAQLLKIFDDKWVSIDRHGSKKQLPRSGPTPPLPGPTPPLPGPTPPLPGPTPRSAEPKQRKVTNLPNSKKPKANVRNKRDMTFEEKQKLSGSLQDLPADKLENVVDIIKKKNPALCQNDEEIEVDIDRVDTETLWELDRFVTNFKKSLTKNKRKAEVFTLASVEPEPNNKKQNLDHAMVTETPKEKNPEEKIISSIPAQEGKSSSSSTNSGSSSSDSDDENSP